jgi:hypothetical protein
MPRSLTAGELVDSRKRPSLCRRHPGDGERLIAWCRSAYAKRGGVWAQPPAPATGEAGLRPGQRLPPELEYSARVTRAG